MFSLTIAAIVFGIIFVAELPDKTALASLMLGTRYRASYVFAGVAAAFLLHVVLAIVAGSLLALLPHRMVQVIVAVLFLAGAAFLLFHHDDEDEEEVAISKRAAGSGFGRVALTSFTVVAVAEFGDLTQIVTANLAAKYHDPISVGVGATLGLWAVAGLAITGGRNLLRILPMPWIIRIAAAAMVAMAGFSIYEAIHG
ncbi:TMEM165/GDT1 family protein [Streptomyces sp. NPDC054933]